MKDFSIGKLIKVTNYSDSLMKGELYCNTLKYFKTSDQQDEMYDLEEGCLRSQCYEPSAVPGKVWKSTFKLEVNAENVYAFCMTCLAPRKVNNEINKGVYQFTKEQDKKFPEFGADTVLINDTIKFIERIKSKCDQKGIKYAHGGVSYGQRTLESIKKELEEKRKEIPLFVAACFRKPVKYEWQQEYRFIFWDVPDDLLIENENKEKHMELKIRSIEDIAYMSKDVFPNSDKNKE